MTIWSVRVRDMWVTIWYLTMKRRLTQWAQAALFHGRAIGKGPLVNKHLFKGEGEGAYWKDDGELKFYGKPRAVLTFLSPGLLETSEASPFNSFPFSG